MASVFGKSWKEPQKTTKKPAGSKRSSSTTGVTGHALPVRNRRSRRNSIKQHASPYDDPVSSIPISRCSWSSNESLDYLQLEMFSPKASYYFIPPSSSTAAFEEYVDVTVCVGQYQNIDDYGRPLPGTSPPESVGTPLNYPVQVSNSESPRTEPKIIDNFNQNYTNYACPVGLYDSLPHDISPSLPRESLIQGRRDCKPEADTYLTLPADATKTLEHSYCSPKQSHSKSGGNLVQGLLRRILLRVNHLKGSSRSTTSRRHQPSKNRTRQDLPELESEQVRRVGEHVTVTGGSPTIVIIGQLEYYHAADGANIPENSSQAQEASASDEASWSIPEVVTEHVTQGLSTSDIFVHENKNRRLDRNNKYVSIIAPDHNYFH